MTAYRYQHTSFGLNRHLHLILDEAYHFDVATDRAIKHCLEDIVMQISHYHGCDDILVRFRKAGSMNEIRVLVDDLLESFGIYWSLLCVAKYTIDAMVIQPLPHELFNPILNLIDQSIVLLGFER